MRAIALTLSVVACASCSRPVPPPATGSATAPRTLRYRVVCQDGRACGQGITRFTAEGARELAFGYLDNGRGPRVRARLTLAPDGTIATLVVAGTDTFGVTLDETLVTRAGRRRWQSHAGSGEWTGPAFYLPASPLPEATGLLAAAALRSGGRLRLLPQGEARVEKEAETVIRGRHLTAFAVTGLDFLPTRVWLDDDRGFFGVADPWLSIVPEGWEGSVAPLLEIQKRLQARRDRESAARLARRPPAAGLAIVHARLFEAEGGRWLPDHTVLVKGGKIEAVGPSPTLTPPSGAEILDAGGKALLPGLWDMHVHLGPADGALNLAAGVTTVRDMTNDPELLADQVRRFDAGEAVGPRVLKVGLVEGVGKSAMATRFKIATEAEGRKAIDYFQRNGYVQLKFYNSVDPALVPVLAREAHARGLRVSGHVPYRMLAEDAVRAGYDEVQHINQLMLQFFADRKTDTRTLLRFTLLGDRARSLDLASRPVTDFVALLKERRVVIDPTVVTFEQLYLARPGRIDPSVAAIADRLPPMVARSYLTGGLAAPGAKDELHRQTFAAMLRFLKLLHDSGLTIVPGTDGLGGFWLHRELELHVAAGIPSAEVLRSATLGAARVMRRDSRSGSIAAGKDADLVLIDGDPIARIGDVRRVVTVVKDGVVFAPAAVHASVGVK
jgi:imidazolonepropionase-like amidohydrolase